MKRSGLIGTAVALLVGVLLTGCGGSEWTERLTPPTPGTEQATDAATSDDWSVPAGLVGDWGLEGTSGLNAHSFESDGTWIWTHPWPDGSVNQCSGPFKVSGNQITMTFAAGTNCKSATVTWSLEGDVLILDGQRYDRQ